MICDEPQKHIGQPPALSDDDLDADDEIWIYLEGKNPSNDTIAIPLMDLQNIPANEVTFPMHPAPGVLRPSWGHVGINTETPPLKEAVNI